MARLRLLALLVMVAVVISCNNSSYQLLSSTSAESLSKEKDDVTPLPAKSDSTFNTEDYDHIVENPFLVATEQPLSTFSIDVDRASYANVRRFINSGKLPPKGAVRIEEMINYFDYSYQAPTTEDPFAVHTEIATCPWNAKHQLIKIGLQGKKISTDNLPASNLVFLVDVSGSMNEPNKLPLVKESLKMLTQQLRSQDRVALVAYAGNAGLVLPSTNGADKSKISNAIDELESGGSTAGGAGIALAYKIAAENLKPDGNNRVILATDGDFNVGVSSDDELVSLIEKQRQTGIFLSVLGFGTGNYKDNKMQQLADKGNGNHNYIDNLSEARKVVVKEFGGTLFTIAKDVKLQIEFNPTFVQAYRLIGYENRLLQNRDFNDDKKDAGELGAGHTVTALYEVIPAGITDPFTGEVDNLKYQVRQTSASAGNEIMTVKLRYKEPQGEVSKLMTYPIANTQARWQEASGDFKLAAGVAEFGLLLRQSGFKQNSSWQQTINLIEQASDAEENEYRTELTGLVKRAETLSE